MCDKLMNMYFNRRNSLLVIAIILIFCAFTHSKVDSKFKALHISWVFQMLIDGELVAERQYADVFCSKDYLIARTRQNNFTVDTRLKPGTNEVLEEKTTIDSSYVYYISKKGEKYGLAFNSSIYKTGKHIKIDVDSFINSTLTPPAFFYSVKSKGKDSMYVERDVDKGILIEKYLNRRREVQEPDSSYFYFRKKPMPYSFIVKDKRDDDMYLYKMRAICNASPNGKFPNINYPVKKYEHAFEIIEIDVPEPELQKVIESFKQASQIIK